MSPAASHSPAVPLLCVHHESTRSLSKVAADTDTTKPLHWYWGRTYRSWDCMGQFSMSS